jgi:hypothetical protein
LNMFELQIINDYQWLSMIINDDQWLSMIITCCIVIFLLIFLRWLRCRREVRSNAKIHIGAPCSSQVASGAVDPKIVEVWNCNLWSLYTLISDISHHRFHPHPSSFLGLGVCSLGG